MVATFKLKDPSLLVQTGIINDAPARSHSGRSSFPIVDPATLETWAHAESMDDVDTGRAIEAAEAAFSIYSKFPARRRARILLELDRFFREAAGDLAQLIVMETGKPLSEAHAEVNYAATYSWFMAGECERIQGETIKGAEQENMRFFVTRHPIGVVGLLCPWNFPVLTAFRKICTALAAGCTCVVKPSPESPISTSALAILCGRAGFPPGCVNVVTASTDTTPAVGEKLCEDPRVKKISFTGSTMVGKLLMGLCAPTLKKLTLELGGNAGWAVFEDADLEKAATALIANKFRAAGQVCITANRVFVHQSIFDKFACLMTEKIRALRIGHGLSPGVTIGPMTTQKGSERCAALVRDALDHGAKVLIGGQRGQGYFFEPTLLVGASHDAKVYTDEMFSPICSLYRFDTEEEVITLCNDTSMGLTNYIFTRDISRPWRCYEKLQSGTVGINTANPNAAESPFGGIKGSGMGKEGGIKHGVEEFCIVRCAALEL